MADDKKAQRAEGERLSVQIMMRAYVTQFEVHRRSRHGGQQVVRVEHVHVNDSGQAFIGDVKKEEAKA